MNKHTLFYFINLVLTFVFIIIITYGLVFPSTFSNGKHAQNEYNNFCQNTSLLSTSDALSLVCNNKYKKQSLIWLFIDGLSYDQIYSAMNNINSNNGVIYKLKVSPYQQVSSLYESLFTGKFSRNYFMKEHLHADNIIHQIVDNTNNTLHYKGNTFPLFHLLLNPNSSFSAIEIIPQESQTLSSICNNESFNACITSLTNNTSSLMFYTNHFDNIVHIYNKTNSFTQKNIHSLAQTISVLMNFTNVNTNYALVVTSLHGGQSFTGEDDICNHGCSQEGNEGFFMLYTNDIQRSSFRDIEQSIDVNDIVPTITQIISNTNVPLHSQGFPKVVNDDSMMKYVALKSKEIQLKQYAMKMSLANIVQLLKRGNVNVTTITDIETNMNDDVYYKQLSRLQNIQNEMEKKMNKSVLLTLVYYFMIICLILVIYYQSKKILLITRTDNAILETKNSTALFTLIMFTLILNSFLCFLFNMLFSTSSIHSTFIHSCLSLLFIISIICVVFISTYKLQNKRYYITTTIMVCICGCILCIMYHYKLVIYMKQYFTSSLTFNLLINYPLTFGYISYELYKYRKHYIDSRLRVKFIYILIPLILCVCFLFLQFDINENVNVLHQTKRNVKLTRFIYTMICVYGIISFVPLYIKKSNYSIYGNKEPIQIKKTKSLSNIRLCFLLFVFFISDETERFVSVIIAVGMNYVLSIQYNKMKFIYWKMICVVAMLSISDALHVAMLNTFTPFNVSFKVNSKCIGANINETPLLSSILYTLHRYKYFLLTSAYLLGIARTSKRKFMKHETFMLRMMMNVQFLSVVLVGMYLFKNGHDDQYVFIFNWIISKWIISFVFDVNFIGWHLVYKRNWSCLWKGVYDWNGVDEEENNENVREDVIEMEDMHEEKVAIN